MHAIKLLYYWLIRTLLFFLPDHPLIMRFRGWLYSFAMQKAGKNFQVAHNVIVVSAEGLSVGNNVYFAYGCVIIAEKDVKIGDNVMLGPMCLVSCSNHSFKDGSYRSGKSLYSPVSIGEGSWMGGGSYILAGAKFPPHSILAANSVISKSFIGECEGIYAGSPAKLVKESPNHNIS